MNPVLWRELLAQARAQGTPWLRVMGGALALILLLFARSNDPKIFDSSGLSAFIGLNKLLVVFVWIAAPILTADCLSKEKREGTMGLLFLTPLSPYQVVIAKAFAHALRIFAIISAAYPVLILPLVFGGVTWQDAVRVALLHLASITFALAAGLAASALTESWLASRLLALAFALASALGFISCYLGWVSLHMWNTVAWLRQRYTLPEVFLQQWKAFSYQIGLHGGGFWWFWHGTPSWAQANARVVTTALAFGSTLVLSALAVTFAAAGLARTWRPAAPNDRWSRTKSVLERWASRWTGRFPQLLNRSPIEWLQRRAGRFWLGTAGCCLYAAIPITYVRLAAAKPGPVWFADLFFYGAIAFTSAASFRRDRDAGLLEALLVTPVGERTLVRARLRGLLHLWLPAALLYAIAIFAIEWRANTVIFVPVAGASLGHSEVPHFDQFRELFHRLAWPSAIAAIGLFAGTVRFPIYATILMALFFFAVVPITEFTIPVHTPSLSLLLAVGVKEALIAGTFFLCSLYQAERRLADRSGQRG